MSKASYVLLVALFCVTSCAIFHKTSDDLTTWESAMQISMLKAEKGEYSYICNNLLAPTLVDTLIKRHGVANWKKEFQKQKLESLAFYFGWLENCEVSIVEDKVFLSGRHGCYATFINVKGRHLLLDLGQRITSM